MSINNLGKTLVIANPTAHSGQGAQGAQFVERFLTHFKSATDSFEMYLTKSMGDATDKAKTAASFDTVIALGGDGVIHEIINGLMTIDKALRPVLGIIPLGSGNDYARTLGMALNKPKDALTQLMQGPRRPVELGLIDNGSKKEYFCETLSFGLDAAIALDTTKKREIGTTEEGEELFIKSGIDIFSKHKGGYNIKAKFDDEKPFEFKDMVFAIHVGPSYGGGFKVTPNADPTDGLLDICYNQKTPSIPRTLALFALAKLERHTSSSILAFTQAKHIEVEYLEDDIPCQADGEEILGNKFNIDVVPNALTVITGETSW